MPRDIQADDVLVVVDDVVAESADDFGVSGTRVIDHLGTNPRTMTQRW